MGSEGGIPVSATVTRPAERELGIPAGAGPRAPYPRFNLLSIPLLDKIVRHRAFQFSLMLVNLLFFALVIMTGLLGTPVGNHNLSIIFVWILWWALLIIMLIPFTARLWCTMCPIPAPGEWLQRVSFIRRRSARPLTLDKKWPPALRNIWIQNFSFLTVALFSAIILTLPVATGVLLSLFILLAIVLSLIYRRRIFCRYICPVGGFIGLYSMVAPLEVRVKDPEVCQRHCGKECIRGSEAGHGCPWMEYPGTLDRNAYCGMCTECVKTCPVNNVAINVRPFGKDLQVRKRHLDEGFKGIIMLTSAIVYSAVMLGPWGWLKEAANITTPSHYLMYAAALIGGNLIVVPGAFLLTTWLSRLVSGVRGLSLKKLFVGYSYALVPIGLMGWIAFSFTFVFINGSYILEVISDPFGWGWDLLGTKHFPWTPVFSGYVPYIQIPTLMLGLSLSIFMANRVSRELFSDLGAARRSMIPVTLFLLGFTFAFLRLYLG
jgi:ferredoxin